MDATANKYRDAHVEWDDRAGVFRVYLVPNPTGLGEDDDPAEDKVMEAVHFESDGATECRLYKAAFVACPKDIGKLKAQGRELGFEKEAAAKRVAKAVKKELERIANGEEGPSNLAVQIAIAMVPKRKGGR